MYSGRYCFSLVTFTFAAAGLACAAQPLTYSQVVERFHANNPQLLAGVVGIDESRANEVTAGLRPNPDFSFTNDQFQWFHGNPYRPLSSAEFIMSVSQLFERRQKRRLRVQSAEEATAMAKTDQADLERTLLFTLRGAFVSLLQAKSLLELAQDNLAYYDKVISVNRDRFNAGDIAKIDFARVELQRVQFESDFENANVNLRTAKIQLLALMDERTPIDQFDVSGEFDYKDDVLVAEELRKIALAARPDLLSASTAIEKARVDNRLAWANGSTDPTIGISYVNNGQPGGQGYNVSIPLRLFDKNQGEKERTLLEINRVERLRQNIVAGIYRDVDSARETLESVHKLLVPYKEKYLGQSAEIREIVSFSFNHGGASLLDFLDAQKSYRDTQLAYRNLVATYLTAASQLNMAVGREVAQ